MNLEISVLSKCRALHYWTICNASDRVTEDTGVSKRFDILHIKSDLLQVYIWLSI